ncbi:MAG: HAD-IA family hydrolase [Nitrospina sp.]|nr:HAD-IA family hydrolase [Nitrospina sp.]
MLSKYKAVFFDVGGTLLRVEPSVGEVYATYARPFGFKGSGKELNRLFHKEWINSGGIESLGEKSGEQAERDFWKSLVFQVFEHSGGLENFEHYFEIIYEAFARKDHWHVFDDVIDSGILEKLKNSSITLGVVSNWDSRLHTILKGTGLAEYFDFILASAEVGSAKPDKKIFIEAIRRSGVKPAEVCHIGDDLRADIRGANSVGIEAILIDRNSKHKKNSLATISSFQELL